MFVSHRPRKAEVLDVRLKEGCRAAADGDCEMVFVGGGVPEYGVVVAMELYCFV